MITKHFVNLTGALAYKYNHLTLTQQVYKMYMYKA